MKKLKLGAKVYVKTLGKKGILGPKSQRLGYVFVNVDNEILEVPEKAIELWSLVKWFIRLIGSIFGSKK